MIPYLVAPSLQRAARTSAATQERRRKNGIDLSDLDLDAVLHPDHSERLSWSGVRVPCAAIIAALSLDARR